MVVSVRRPLFPPDFPPNSSIQGGKWRDWMVGNWSNCLNFRMKRNCKIRDKMGCNGLGNRCSVSSAPEIVAKASSAIHGLDRSGRVTSSDRE
jgi:hypothetical protein